MAGSKDYAMNYIAAHNLAPAICKALGISRQAISQWERVPHLRVREVAKITGLSLTKIRPDIYPKSMAGT